MWDIIIAVLLGIILVEMARFGGYVSSNPPSDLKVARKYTNRFRVYAILACVLIVIQAMRTYRASEHLDGLLSQIEQNTQKKAELTLDGVDMPIALSPGAPVKLNFYFHNSGNADARNVMLDARAIIASGAPTPQNIDGLWANFSSWVAARASAHMRGTDMKIAEQRWFTTEEPAPQVTSDEIGSIQSGQEFVYLMAQLRYFDIRMNTAYRRPISVLSCSLPQIQLLRSTDAGQKMPLCIRSSEALIFDVLPFQHPYVVTSISASVQT